MTIVNRWDINTKRNINYRSLAPIISLLGVSHTRECQLWAAWAVANLTLFDEDKYCPLVEEEVRLTTGCPSVPEVRIDFVFANLPASTQLLRYF